MRKVFHFFLIHSLLICYLLGYTWTAAVDTFRLDQDMNIVICAKRVRCIKTIEGLQVNSKSITWIQDLLYWGLSFPPNLHRFSPR